MGLEYGLLPWQWWAMTPGEFSLWVDAQRRRDEREWYRTAWAVAYLLTPWSKKKITPAKLLGRVQATGGGRRRPPTAEATDADED